VPPRPKPALDALIVLLLATWLLTLPLPPPLMDVLAGDCDSLPSCGVAGALPLPFGVPGAPPAELLDRLTRPPGEARNLRARSRAVGGGGGRHQAQLASEEMQQQRFIVIQYTMSMKNCTQQWREHKARGGHTKGERCRCPSPQTDRLTDLWHGDLEEDHSVDDEDERGQVGRVHGRGLLAHDERPRVHHVRHRHDQRARNDLRYVTQGRHTQLEQNHEP
jgi:hypothetical protein